MESESTAIVKCGECGLEESIETVQLRADSQMGLHSLILSSITTIIVLLLHAYFLFNGKIYEVPDIAWAIILGPWLGVGAAKIRGLLKK